MKRFMLTLAALAAIVLPAQAQSIKDSPIIWTGPYAGILAGYGWGGVDVRDTNGGVLPGPFSYDTDGIIGGAVLGYNHQIDRVVAGIEIEGGWMDLGGKGKIPSSTPPHFQAIDLEGGMYGMLTGRLGFTVDRTLIYGKGGWAYWDGDAGQKTTKPGFVTHRTGPFSGFVYGAGAEHKLSERMSIRLEWMRFDFGSETGDQTSVADAPIGFKYINKHDITADRVTLGLNFKF